MNIGNRIRNLRLAKQMKTTEVARKAFISQPYLSDIERGRTTPSIDKLQAICDVLGISLSEFFGETMELPPNTQQLLKTIQQLTDEEQQQLNNFIELILKR
ncbi:helix-turn-helix domain-containing protein [Gracilibacillus alcaliphilus]|uniref:helix-turn-helix domain-containing protein n=1 Tax=Gracilibacillus alcaliphilus TaxID=1401441 RepID=UPI00195BC56E|nr:helix-turn-helix transcriptional regulator [Gracilibacillus alcaliphilus]MBM7676756.1 transcriptional regulator with XRE-family HTH domain [Gracilibacillus alcaliphilus]